METKNTYIKIEKLCQIYHIPKSFFDDLEEHDLLLSHHYNKNDSSINEEYLGELEKIMRLHFDLKINMEGIDVVMDLLKKIELLENELYELKKLVQLTQ